VRFILGNLLKSFRKPVDIIISNPPYVAPGENVYPELRFEPEEAYISPPDGLTHIKKILEQGKEILRENGVFLIEISPTLSPYLKKKYPASRIIKDLAGLDRVFVLYN